MFFIISKSLAFLIKPLGIYFILIFLIIINKNHTKKKNLLSVLAILLYLFSSPIVSEKIYKIYEPKNIEINNLTDSYEYAVVLTGGIINNENRNEVSLGKQSDRIWKALQLYKQNKVRKILISGGEWRNGYIIDNLTENDKSKLFLIENGVNPQHIFQEEKSRNTNENAIYSKEFLKNIRNQGKILLITSAFHMPRSSMCFRKQGIQHDTFPVNITYRDNNMIGFDSFVPSTKALTEVDTLFKEWAGLIAYKIAGYI
jgi:uncharacterized SAM-binding protein YcdF (DUF218 family)